MQDKPIYLEKKGHVADLVLNRPDKRNAMNAEVWEGVVSLLDEVRRDRDIKVVILRGSTPEAFAAGADISEFPKVHATPESAKAYHEGVRRAYDAVATLDRPTIAMIQGVCFGGGCALSLCCDLRYCDETASFCIPPARLGIAYSLHETKRLADLVGPSRCKEMLMGAKVIPADEAVRIGLATRMFPSADLQRETHAFADHLAGLSQFTIRAVKATVEEILHGAVDDTAASRERSRQAFEGPDYIEGRNAFLEKRKAKFTWS